MNKEQAKKRIQELREKTEYYAKKYYDDDNPDISDFEYDMLMVELRNLEKEYPEFISKESLTQKVGGHVKEGFEKVTHEVPLQSLQDVFSLEDIEDFCHKMEEKAMCVRKNRRKNYESQMEAVESAAGFDPGPDRLRQRRSERGHPPGRCRTGSNICAGGDGRRSRDRDPGHPARRPRRGCHRHPR